MILRKIADFYRKYEDLGLKITFALIALQIIHLYWLTTDVVLARSLGESFFAFPQVPQPLFVAIDYLEIPALFSGIVFYGLAIYNNKNSRRSSLFLILLAVQIFHIFWITDEVLYEILFSTIPIAIPAALAWVAISIDYLELPVMADLFYRLFVKKSSSPSRSRSA